MWDKPPSLFGDVVERAAVERVQDIASDMIVAVAERSPVDTGRFAANNQVSIGERSNKYNAFDFSGRQGAITRGIATIEGMPKNKLQDVWIYNDTPYGKYLEDTLRYRGSAQAPNGVYRVSFMGVAVWYR